MKRILAVSVLIASLILNLAVYAQDIPAETQPDITVTLDGVLLEFDVSPQLVNDCTMLPMRAIFEAFGANVTWLAEDQIIFATKGSKVIVMKIGDFNLSVQSAGEDGNTVVTLDVAPYIEDGRTLVPVRAISESLGADVEWVSETRSVVITTEQEGAN